MTSHRQLSAGICASYGSISRKHVPIDEAHPTTGSDLGTFLMAGP